MRRTVILLLSGLACIGMPTDGAFARPLPTQRAPSIDVYAVEVAEASQRFGIAEDRIRAVIRAESGGDPRAVSTAGAMGLMQIMPATWASLSARYGLGIDPFDPRANILAGAAYLRAMLDRYGDVGLALAAYNAGPGRVDDWRIGGRSLPAETIAYVARIAPTMGGPGLAAQMQRTVIARDWRIAALFMARSADLTSAGSTMQTAWTADRSEAVPAPKPVRPDTGDAAIQPPYASLFVRRSGAQQ